MPKEKGRTENKPKLPNEVKSLVTRKLHHSRLEQDRLLLELNQAAYSRLRKEILECLNTRQVGKIFTEIPLDIYSEIVANAMTVTREWPLTVWQTIASILDKSQGTAVSIQELNAIIDEFAWGAEKHPFTLDLVDPDRFRDMVTREALSYGLANENTASSHRQWDIAAALAKSGIINTARQSREGISIAIEEYLLEQVGNASPTEQHSKSSFVRREARKQKTQAMYESWHKEYRKLKKDKPGKTDTWYAQQISKMACAQGRDAETIRRNLKQK